MIPLQLQLDALCDAHAIPSASLCVQRGGREVFHHTTGLARLSPPTLAVDNQAYDLASLTKALVGSPLAASFIQDGSITLDQPIADFLPDVHPAISLRQLLNHSSGLLWWRPLYEGLTEMWGTRALKERLLTLARTGPLQTTPGTTHRYSDLGYLTLMALYERLGEAPLEQLFYQRILAPSQVKDLRWGWPNAAATERCPVRKRLIQGEVHDLNCAALGGISTHAGLFGTARSVASLGSAFLHAARSEAHPLPGASLKRLWIQPGVGSHTCGWDRVSTGKSSTGHSFPTDTIGHLGYTGCSLWMSPSTEVTVALLTNRIHPLDTLDGIRAFRPQVHDAVAELLGWR